MYTLKREQYLNQPLGKVWNFLNTPHNLNHITPPDLHFEIITEVPEEMYNGLIIEYKIRIPLIGSQRWVSEIKHIRDMHSFVDEQRYGPYRFWYHYHEITETEKGVKSVDLVHYQPPFGPLGKLLHQLSIRKTLDRIFDYRKTRLAEIFA